LTGINDIDVFYFDDSDIGWDAEDRVIRAVDARFAGVPVPVQVRNQARGMTPSSLGESVYETGARSLVSFSVR